MKSFAAKDAKDAFGRMLDTALVSPVAIEKHGRRVAVVMSADEFERLQALENEYWVGRAAAGEKSGYLPKQASAKLLQKMLKG